MTHDQEEALSISDRIVVMNEGRVEQIGTPSEIYNFPRTRFVASFVGTLNLLSGQVVDPASGKIVVGGQELRTSHALQFRRRRQAADARRAPGGDRARSRRRTVAIRLQRPWRRSISSAPWCGSEHAWTSRVISLDVFNDPNRRLPERGQPVALGFSHENLLVLEEGAEQLAS